MKHFKPGTNRETIASALDGCWDLFSDDEVAMHFYREGFSAYENGAGVFWGVVDELRAERLAEARAGVCNDNR